MFLLIQFFTYILITLSANPPYGKLYVNNKGQLIGNQGKQVQLIGLSLFHSQWAGGYYNEDSVRAIKCFFNGNIVRAAIGTVAGGYMDNKNKALNSAFSVIDAAIRQGIYVLVDWHDEQNHNDNEMIKLTNCAIDFFTIILNKYKGVPNILLELWNEPNGVKFDVAKKYYLQVYNAVRNLDKDVVVIVGSPDVLENLPNHIVGTNIL
ncbi:Beta-1,4-endoglucanase [Meloidogyne graminicola]|uniref:Beta-1,4-endoglucanase n=1 Tax=Meloidogyne graminicola TaxID=189291 RepID=A0A8T0A397_9BILA|nr:Beta-1,4-endoglucanase [Meloidogyne graminicola]